MPRPIIPVYIGEVPNRNQNQDQFSSNADSWLAYQEPLASDYNALAEFLNKYNYADGGFFTPTSGQQYPTITEFDLNVYYQIVFPNSTDTYTYTSGNLNGVTVQNGTVLRFDNETSTWEYQQPFAGGVSQGSFDLLEQSMIGQIDSYPPNTDDNFHPARKRIKGQLLSRASHSKLWAWIQTTQGDQIVDDATWLSLKSSSYNGAVSAFSTGDGSTTFRMIDEGDGGFDRSTGNVTDPVLLNVGFRDQIVNITGEYSIRITLNNGHIVNDGIGSFSVEENSSTRESFVLNTSSPEGYTNDIISLDASRQVNTGSEVQPKGQYRKQFMYVGI